MKSPMSIVWSKLKKMGIGKGKIEGALKDKEEEARNIIKDKNKMEKLIGSALKLCDKLSRLPMIGQVFNDLPLACEMISDYIHGRYRDVPLATIITLTGAIIYLLVPVDLMLDAIPVVGQLDDAAVFCLAAAAAHNDLEAYACWKAEQE